jgi:hypothetical protein
MRDCKFTWRHRSRRDDHGASLVLAMVLLLVCSTVVIALSSAATNDLNNVKTFTAVRVNHALESSATDVALYEIRFSPTICTDTNPIPYPNPSPTLNVWCHTYPTPLSPVSRVVDFYTCPTSVTTYGACKYLYGLHAIAVFDDYATKFQLPMTTECVTNCGAGMSITEWKFR